MVKYSQFCVEMHRSTKKPHVGELLFLVLNHIILYEEPG
jgi:hypothetical protein